MTASLGALRAAYGDLSALVLELDEAASWRPTGCAGWAVRDLVQHLLGDAQRALVALATPADGPADRDATTYWIDAPGAPDANSRGIRATRTMASQWALPYLTATYADARGRGGRAPSRPDRGPRRRGARARGASRCPRDARRAAGAPHAADWDDYEWIRAATGRGERRPAHRAVLGSDVDRLPLLR